MRTHGTLTKWNDDRGFGFISPAQGSSEIFVHISAFPRDGVRPTLKELVSYETQTSHDGKLRAVRIMRPGGSSHARVKHSHEARGRSSDIVGTILGILVIVVLGALVHPRLSDQSGIGKSDEIPQITRSMPATVISNSSFTCDGRTRCSEMTSCAEAEYFLNHCPDTKMDGDHDGVPCEQQWCQ